jgi:hypothetical protein
MIEAQDPSLSLDSQVRLHSLSRQVENRVAIIGRGDQFLELPPEGLDFIDWLNQGMSLAEARERFEARYNPFSEEEVLAVVEAFLESDFVATIDGQIMPPRHTPLQANAPWLSPKWAQAIFSTPVLLAWLTIVIPAVILWITTPALWPRRADFFWSEYYFIIVLVGLLLWLAHMASHELAHWLACRAKGIEATITWTQRMGFLPMSQTIMHNIWAVPRPARLLPIAAGMIWDVFRMSLVLYLLFFHQAGYLAWPPLVINFLKYYVLSSTLALTAQFWLFSRMDGYFLLSALFGLRNLQGDTYAWLKSKFSRSSRFDPPASGMKFIYIYALVTVLWGGLFITQFLLINLPIKIQLIWQSWLKTIAGPGAAPLAFADGLATLLSQFIDLGLLAYVYWRETWPEWRRG